MFGLGELPSLSELSFPVLCWIAGGAWRASGRIVEERRGARNMSFSTWR